MQRREESLIKPASNIHAVMMMADKHKRMDFDSAFKKLVSQNKRALDILSKQ
ncbi:Uncharacterised protein [uncultured archaeon]|nr:Uncharacterised protein [uncultured archaeon]